MLRLRRLELTNFRSYPHLVLDFGEPRTLIIGENGAGKSTIIDAIALALTGRCRGMNDKGEGARELIRTGATEATIKLTADGLDTIVVAIHALHGQSRNQPVAMVLGRLNTTQAMVTAAIYGGTFFDMHHTDAKALLMRLLHVQVKVPVRQIPPGDDAGYELIELDEADRRYKVATENRASLKRSIAAIKVPDVARRIDLEMLSAEDLKTEIAQARKTYEAAVAATADVKVKVKNLTELRAELYRSPDGGAGAATMEGKIVTHQESLAEHKKQQDVARAKLQKAEALKAEPADALAVQVNELKVFVQRVEGFAGAKGDVITAECVLGKAIPCHTPAADFAGAIASTKKEMANLEKRIQAGTKRAEAVAAANTALAESTKHVTYHEGLIVSLRQQVEAEQRRRENLDQVSTDLAALQPQAVAGEQQVEVAADALAKAQTLDRERANYQRDIDSQAAQSDQLVELKKDLADAEALVLLLGPNGARATALEAALNDFHMAINAALEPFKFELAINVDPWRVQVLHERTKVGLNFELLSKGQRLWTGLAFQMALAAVSGLEFVVVDDAEGVVGQARGTMTELILQAPIGQVVIVKAQARTEPVPAIDGLQVVQVDGAPVMAGV